MKLSATRLFLSTACALSLAPPPAFAQSPPASTPTAGSDILKEDETLTFLNTRLSSLLDTCLGGDAKMKKKARDKLVAVPSKLKNFVERESWQKHWRFGNSNVASFFGYVFSENEIQSSSFADSSENYLATDFNQPLQSILQTNISGDQFFEQNCQAAFSAAVRGGVSIGSIAEAAGRAAVNGKRQSRSEIAAGTFVSPFDPTTLMAGNHTDQQFMLYLSYWDWRSRVGAQRGFLFKDIKGIAIRQYTTTQNAFSTSGRASGGVSLPFLSFKAKAQGSVTGQQSFSENSSVFIFADKPSQDITKYFEIPTIQQINKAISSNANASAQILGGESTLDVGSVAEIEMSVPWLTRKHCQGKNDYNVIDPVGGSVVLQYVGQKADAPGCDFRLKFSPDSAAVAAGRGSVSFKLKRTTSFAGVAVDGFELPVTEVPFVLNNPYKISIPNDAIDITNNNLGGELFQYQWKLSPEISTNDGFSVTSVQAVDVEFDDACILNEINATDGIQSQLVTLSQTKDSVKLRWTIGLLADYNKLRDDKEGGKNPVCFMKGNYLITVGSETYEIPIKPYDAILVVPSI